MDRVLSDISVSCLCGDAVVTAEMSPKASPLHKFKTMESRSGNWLLQKGVSALAHRDGGGGKKDYDPDFNK